MWFANQFWHQKVKGQGRRAAQCLSKKCGISSERKKTQKFKFSGRIKKQNAKGYKVNSFLPDCLTHSCLFALKDNKATKRNKHHRIQTKQLNLKYIFDSAAIYNIETRKFKFGKQVANSKCISSYGYRYILFDSFVPRKRSVCEIAPRDTIHHTYDVNVKSEDKD